MDYEWNQRPAESARAYAAFLIYLQLGSDRDLNRTGERFYPRGVNGAPTGRRRGATGRIREWAKRFAWAERASAWDHHRQAIALQAIERETAATAADWVRRREELHRRTWALASKLYDRAEQLAEATETTVNMPADPMKLRAAAAVAVQAKDLASWAVDVALQATASQPRPVPDDDALLEAERKLEAWRVEQLARLRAFSPTEPPWAIGGVNH